jgi:NAD+ kinase
MNKKVYIYVNNTEVSKKIEQDLRNKLVKSGLRAYKSFDDDTDLLLCIGGDGTLLNLMQDLDFPKTPVVGINTGHLGFFQEVKPEQMDDMIFQLSQEQYTLQSFSTVKCIITTDSGEYRHTALNEIAVKGAPTYPIHLNISINESFIERFSGDGLCLATPAGSTAYNYSLGGSIVDPRLNLLQVTPIAPMNSIAYRSFTSSLLLPASDTLTIRPCRPHDDTLTIVYDGRMEIYEQVQDIKISLSRRKVNMVRFGDLRFWDKAKIKFL